MAKPLPMAAVVFPAASKASVIYQIFSPIQVIYVIPPALSQIGPKVSIAKLIDKLLSIPIAAKEIPNIPSKFKEIKIVKEINKIGITVL